MSTFTKTLTAVNDAALQAATAAHNATLPDDADPLTPHEYLSAILDSALASYAVQFLQLPVGEFVSRFSGAEFDAVKALAETDSVVAGFVARIRQPEPINIASPAFTAALQYLASKGCIAAGRVAALSALPA